MDFKTKYCEKYTEYMISNVNGLKPYQSTDNSSYQFTTPTDLYKYRSLQIQYETLLLTTNYHNKYRS